jgi:hypothetical protein
LVFDHGVKDHCDLMGGCHGCSLGAQLGFHSTQVVAQGREQLSIASFERVLWPNDALELLSQIHRRFR